MTIIREFDRTHPCDRCGHALWSHPLHYGSACAIYEGKVWHGALHKMPKAKRCWCDGYVPRSA